jgi:vacuolar protein-sorting-associated protein 4
MESIRRKAIDLVKKAASAARPDHAKEFYSMAISLYEELAKTLETQPSEKLMHDAVLASLKEWKKQKKRVGAQVAVSALQNSTVDDDEDGDSESELILLTSPGVRWEDVAGLHQAKERLQEALLLPQKFPHLFTGKGKLDAWKGILLYGPPGGGKSLLAKAVATEIKCSFIAVSVADILSKYIGESETKVRALFTLARKNKPAVLFLDEVDALCSMRGEGAGGDQVGNKVIAEFLTQWDGVGKDQSGVLVMGATNLPWQLDTGIRRRLERRIYIPPPDDAARLELAKIQLKDLNHSLTTGDVNHIVQETAGFSGADVANLFKDLKYRPLNEATKATHFRLTPSTDQYEACLTPDEDGAVPMRMYDITPSSKLALRPINTSHLKQALPNARSSITTTDLLRFTQWTAQYGENGE